MMQGCCQKGKNKKEVVSGAEKGKKKTLVVIAVVIASLFVAGFFLSGEKRDNKFQAIQASGDVIKIPIKQIEGPRAHFFNYKTEGADIKFFVLRSSDGVIRSAFDACDECYVKKLGYRQAGDFMICINCENKFPSVGINVIRGGCNPAPLERTVEGNYLVVKVSDLRKGMFYFS